MRKPIEEALKWFQQKRALRLSRDPQAMALGNQAEGIRGRSKVVTIQVVRCLNLKRPQQTAVTAFRMKEMQPFFYFQFYTFEGYLSPVMTGASPNYDVRKQYEVEVTDQFLDYMKTQLL